MSTKTRSVTGDRPTGPLHLGHYLGTLTNRLNLQSQGIEQFVVIADFQVITDRVSTDAVQSNVREVLLDQLAAGIDATFVVHSQALALNALMLPFLSLVSTAELDRNPTVKAEAAAAKLNGRAMPALLHTYPVHQACDILSLGGTVVPVGRDQIAHLEVARTIARRFNERYGECFTEPEPLLTATPKVLGSDGAKMSKSRGNALALKATEDETARFFKRAKSDSDRHITYDPEARPEVSNLLEIAGQFTERDPAAIAEELGGAGSGALKALTTEAVNEGLKGLRARRRELVEDRHLVQSTLDHGIDIANDITSDTFSRVNGLMRLGY